jgi:hypothetical protein
MQHAVRTSGPAHLLTTAGAFAHSGAMQDQLAPDHSHSLGDNSKHSDAEFVALHTAYRASGGLASGNELATRLNRNGEGGYASLARYIVGRRVFSLAWNSEFWVPMFQFTPDDLSLRPGLRPVLLELTDVMDGWAIASWFVTPNNTLKGHSPLAMWLSDWPDVFCAARLQRLVMKG